MIANEEAKRAIFNSTLTFNCYFKREITFVALKITMLLYILKIISMYITLFLNNSHSCPKIYFWLLSEFN